MLSKTIVNWAMEKNTREDFIFYENGFIQFSLWLQLSVRCIGSCFQSGDVITFWTGHRNWPLWASCHPKLTAAHLMQKSFTTFLHFTVAESTPSHLLGQTNWGAKKAWDKVYRYQMSGALDNACSEKPREWLSDGKCCRAFAECDNCSWACPCSLGGHREGGQAKEGLCRPQMEGLSPERPWTCGRADGRHLRWGKRPCQPWLVPPWQQRLEEPACGGHGEGWTFPSTLPLLHQRVWRVPDSVWVH